MLAMVRGVVSSIRVPQRAGYSVKTFEVLNGQR